MEPPRQHNYFNLVNALLIALVTLMGAFVAWRASVAADGAGDASLDGLMAERNVQETRALHKITHYQNYRAYTSYLRYNLIGDQIEADMEQTPDLSEESAALLERQKQEAWNTAEVAVFPRNFLKRNGAYDTERELGEAWADASREIDLDPQTHFQEADQQQTKSNRLLGILTVLAVALIFFTLAEEFERRSLKYTMAALGLVLALGGVAATVAVEYALLA